MRQKTSILAGLVLAALGLSSAGASADINIGIVICSTGPGAAQGLPQKNTVPTLPTTIAGQHVNYLLLDDKSDTTSAVQDMRKLITEDHVDAIIGSSITPNSLAMTPVAAETGTPVISLAGSASVIEPMDGPRKWVFKTPQNDALMASAIVDFMVKRGIKTVGYIGFADSYGSGWDKVFTAAAQAKGITVSVHEAYNRNDTSVTGQVLRIIGQNPQAVLIGGAGTPAALPQSALKAQHYKGVIFQTHGAASNDFLRVCGADCEGMFLPAGPLLVADQLPASNPVKAQAMVYKGAYEKLYGPGSVVTFGGHLWDAERLLAAAIPGALSKAQPGTPEFRSALRDSLENVHELTVSQGVLNMSPTDHNGMDARARVMVEVKNGKWTYVAQ